jgi:hypothetical protein
MARPTKETVDYFPHTTNHGSTMYILEEQWGNDGYAFWFKMLEMLGAKPGLHIDTNKPKDWKFLLAKTRLTEVSATEILNCLSELEAIDTDLWAVGVIYSQKFVDGVKPAFQKRKGFIPTKTQLMESFRVGNPPTSGVSGGNPAEETGRGEEIKGKEIKGKGDKKSSDNSAEKSAPPWREEFAPEVVEFVEQFQGYVAQTQGAKAPKVNDTLLKTCADTVDRLIRLDKHSLTTVVDVMRWAVADDFWSSNVLSLASLRKKKEAGGQTKFQKILAAYERTSVTSLDVLNEMVRRVEGGKRTEEEGVCADIKAIAPHSGTGPTRYAGAEADTGDSGALAGGCGAQAGGDLDRW